MLLTTSRTSQMGLWSGCSLRSERNETPPTHNNRSRAIRLEFGFGKAEKISDGFH